MYRLTWRNDSRPWSLPDASLLPLCPNASALTPTSTRTPPSKGKQPGVEVTSVIMSISQKDNGTPTFGGLVHAHATSLTVS